MALFRERARCVACAQHNLLHINHLNASASTKWNDNQRSKKLTCTPRSSIVQHLIPHTRHHTPRTRTSSKNIFIYDQITPITTQKRPTCSVTEECALYIYTHKKDPLHIWGPKKWVPANARAWKTAHTLNNIPTRHTGGKNLTT